MGSIIHCLKIFHSTKSKNDLIIGFTTTISYKSLSFRNSYIKRNLYQFVHAILLSHHYFKANPLSATVLKHTQTHMVPSMPQYAIHHSFDWVPPLGTYCLTCNEMMTSHLGSQMMSPWQRVTDRWLLQAMWWCHVTIHISRFWLISLWWQWPWQQTQTYSRSHSFIM